MDFNEMNIDTIFWKSLRDTYLIQRGNGELYQHNSRIAPSLISFFYNLFPHPYFNLGLKRFKSKYIFNETEIEQTLIDENHSKTELMGMAEMYKYIEDYEITFDEFTIFEVRELHRQLYAHAPYPECAGVFRNSQALIAGNGVEPSPPEKILNDFFELSDEFDQIMKLPINTTDDIINYINASIVLTTKLLKVHPFFDGNGRSIRGLLNLMFKKANIPPVYILPKEKLIYERALKRAQVDNEYSQSNYDEIMMFYLYKICDSLIEITDDFKNISPNQVEVDDEGVKLYKRI